MGPVGVWLGLVGLGLVWLGLVGFAWCWCVLVGAGWFCCVVRLVFGLSRLGLVGARRLLAVVGFGWTVGCVGLGLVGFVWVWFGLVGFAWVWLGLVGFACVWWGLVGFAWV